MHNTEHMAWPRASAQQMSASLRHRAGEAAPSEGAWESFPEEVVLELVLKGCIGVF